MFDYCQRFILTYNSQKNECALEYFLIIQKIYFVLQFQRRIFIGFVFNQKFYSLTVMTWHDYRGFTVADFRDVTRGGASVGNR